MEKIIIRPKNFIYFLVYFFTVIFWIIAISTIYGYIFNAKQISWVEMLALFLCLLLFSQMSIHFLSVKIVLEGKTVSLNKSQWIKREKDEKFEIKKIFFYNGGYEQKILTEEFHIDRLEKYGFTKDFEISSFENLPIPLPRYASQEIVFIMADSTMHTLNPRAYTKASVRKIISYISNKSGLMPVGKLNDL
ncbi:MAG: hypothetical protein RBR71_01880 [Gudongella sp.]|nr:hypothetical protein [Gudongella sp.]